VPHDGASAGGLLGDLGRDRPIRATSGAVLTPGFGVSRERCECSPFSTCALHAGDARLRVPAADLGTGGSTERGRGRGDRYFYSYGDAMLIVCRALRFEVLSHDTQGRARRGRCSQSRHRGDAGVCRWPPRSGCDEKALRPHELRGLGAEIVLAKAYQLSLRPGAERSRLGGLVALHGVGRPRAHRQDGGFQVFSGRSV